MALANVMRASSLKDVPLTPSNTSFFRNTPSAGELGATWVMRICRALVVCPTQPQIQPRAPVGPSVQSCFPSGFPPVVKSGTGGGDSALVRPQHIHPAAMRIAA